MKALALGWTVAKEDNIGVYFLCPGDTGDNYAVPAQSVYVPKNKCGELAEWLLSLPGVEKPAPEVKP